MDSLLFGAMQRTYYLAKAAKNLGIDVYLAHPGRTYEKNGIFYIHYGFTFKSWQFETLNSFFPSLNPLVIKDLSSLIEEIKPDIVQIEQPYLFILSKILRKVNFFKKVCVVLDEHNVEFLAMKKPNTLLLLPYVKYAEKIALNASDAILVTSALDKHLLTKLYDVPKEKIFVIPNCIDISKYSKEHASINKLKLRVKEVAGFDHIALFHGTLSYYPNYEAANIIITKIAPIIKECLFIIAGKDCPYSLIRKAKRIKNVRIFGYVKEIEKWLAICDVYVAPILRGSGTRIKILEAMATGCPIIATHKAVEGLGVKDGVHGLFYRKVNEDFIEGIRKLLKNDQLAYKLGKNARFFVKRYDWSTIDKKLYEVYSKFFPEGIGHDE